MATRTDLSGFLRDDTPSLHSLLHAAIARGELQGPWKAVGNFQTYGTTGTPQVCVAVGEGMTVGAVDNLVNDLAQQITDKLGLDPRGKLRVKIYETGSSGHPQVDHTRRLEVKLYEGDQESNAELRAQLTEERNHNFRLMGQLFEQQKLIVEQAGQSNTLAASAVQGTMQIGTVRGQVAAASDAGHIDTILGAAALFIGLPLLRSAFDLPEDMPLDQIAKIAAERFKRAIFGPTQGGNVSTSARIPMQERPLLEAAGDEDTETTEDAPTCEGDAAAPRPEPAVVLEWLREDPAWGRSVYKAILADAPLVATLMEAA